MQRNIRLAVVIFFMLLVVIFTLQNIEIVSVKLLWWDITMSRSILVLSLLLIGFLIGRFIGFKQHRKNKAKTNQN